MVDGCKPRIQNAGVVDKHVHLPERLNRLLHQPAAVRVDGDIRGYRKHGTALRFATPSNASFLRALMTTFAPSLANSRAVASPTPELPPVMIAVFPSNNFMISS